MNEIDNYIWEYEEKFEPNVKFSIVSQLVMWELEKFYQKDKSKNIKLPIEHLASEVRKYNPQMDDFEYNFKFTAYTDGIVGD